MEVFVVEYSYTPLYYGTPCQVKYWDADNGEYFGGIALHDFIIDGLTGDILITDKVVKRAAADGVHWDDAVIELEWLDISDAILRQN